MPTVIISGLGKREVVKYASPATTLSQIRDAFCAQANLQNPSTVVLV